MAKFCKDCKHYKKNYIFCQKGVSVNKFTGQDYSKQFRNLNDKNADGQCEDYEATKIVASKQLN